jgi:hypothetical protein
MIENGKWVELSGPFSNRDHARDGSAVIRIRGIAVRANEVASFLPKIG